MQQTAEPVSRQHQIARAALACFSRAGFHGASMQDICAEAGMSAGALYRYFPSKAAIIVAIVEAEREAHAQMFQPLDDAPDPLAALQELGEVFLTHHLSGVSGMLASDVVAEAARNPEVQAAVEKTATFIRETLTRALVRGQTLGVVDPSLDTEAAGYLIMSLGDGMCAQPAGPPGLDAPRIVATLNLLLTRFCRPAGDLAS